jgi:phage-related protein
MADFTWVPDYDAQEQTEPVLLEARFGDGYVVSAPDGINNMLRSWSFAFNNVSEEMAADIITFLRTKGGWNRFTFTLPQITPAETVLVVCKSWSKVYSGYKSYNITCKFEERL